MRMWCATRLGNAGAGWRQVTGLPGMGRWSERKLRIGEQWETCCGDRNDHSEFTRQRALWWNLGMGAFCGRTRRPKGTAGFRSRGSRKPAAPRPLPIATTGLPCSGHRYNPIQRAGRGALRFPRAAPVPCRAEMAGGPAAKDTQRAKWSFCPKASGVTRTTPPSLT
jgi:hypothetical protein